MEKKKLICVTKFKNYGVTGFGKFENGDSFDFPINVANQLLESDDWELKKDPKPKVTSKKDGGDE